MNERRDEAFEALFDATYGRATRAVRRITGDQSVAEELAAEALVRAYARWPRLSREDHAEWWVLRVAVNLAIDTARRRPAPVGAAPAHDGEIDAVTTRLALVAGLRSLPRRQRAAVSLRYLADLSEADVAAALGVSAGSVKTHLHRGLARLRQVLGDEQLEVSLVDR